MAGCEWAGVHADVEAEVHMTRSPLLFSALFLSFSQQLARLNFMGVLGILTQVLMLFQKALDQPGHLSGQMANVCFSTVLMMTLLSALASNDTFYYLVNYS